MNDKLPSYSKPTTSFMYKMLTAMRQIQIRTPKGVTVSKLVKFMETLPDVTGDVQSQVETSLSMAEKNRLVLKKNNTFNVIVPVAKIQLVPRSSIRAEVDDLKNSFGTLYTRKQSKSLIKNYLEQNNPCLRPRVRVACPCVRKRSNSKSRSRSPIRKGILRRNPCNGDNALDASSSSDTC